jgi:periplasmic divalent cation tolerance protein
MAFLIFYVTHSDEESAQTLSGALLEKRLIACANILPVTSAYWWQGEVQQEGEWVSILKTRTNLEDAVEKAILELHSYQTPCILRFPVSANASYEEWIDAETMHKEG